MPSFRALATVASNLLGELVAPSRCAGCDERVGPSALFCSGCAPSVERCEQTAIPERRSGAWLASFEYGGAVSAAVVRLKYGGRPDLGPRLGRSMLRAAEPFSGAIDLVIPVPLHPRRLAERGYNQAALLAAPIARTLETTFAPRALERSRDTPRQALLDRGERLENVAGAFSVRASAPVRGARVLLIDDVRTTGATIAECAHALASSGAASVVALVLARRA